MANHLESIISEYLQWKGYLVTSNRKVGKLAHGGWEMELDVVGFNPETNHLVHYEPSIDANSWIERERRFKKKFESARKYIFSEVFPWLPGDTPIEQFAVLTSHPEGRDQLSGGSILSIDELVAHIAGEIFEQGPLRRKAISEQFPHLRTVQLLLNGYSSSKVNRGSGEG